MVLQVLFYFMGTVDSGFMEHIEHKEELVINIGCSGKVGHALLHLRLVVGGTGEHASRYLF